jgi:hypothetical protein
MTRRQLSLYVPSAQAAAIEGVRAVVDPLQHGLIPAHVTLCRDEELGDMARIKDRLANIPLAPIKLVLGPCPPFFEHGLLLPCVEGEPAFRALREYILGSNNIKDLQPHLTLAHPRNPRSEGNSLALALQLPARLSLVFPVVQWIEQAHATQPWCVRASFPLAL